MALNRKLRFEVFKRDSFTCQYCGRSAPEVLLEADHIKPVAKGGKDTILNLITACKDCNGGKSAVPLTDQTVLAKQKRQLAELQERKEQLEMMFEWQKSLMNLDDQAVDLAAKLFEELVSGQTVNDHGRKSLAKLIKKFGLAEVMEAMRTMASQYDLSTQEKIGIAFSKIGGICRLKSADPATREMFYIRGILRNRISYVNEGMVMFLLREAIDAGADIQKLKQLATEVRSWTQWRETLEDFIANQDNDEH